MSDLMETIFIGSLLLFSAGFILFRLGTRTTALFLNKTPACHGGNDETCARCHSD